MSDAAKFHLRVTAGPSYDASQHKTVPVNTDKPIEISSSSIDASLAVRIQNYRGLPANSPESSGYFKHAPHTSDLYSISFRFRLPEDIPGSDMVFGNDFASPIRNSLPPGFGAALKFVQWSVDPGMDGDVYADNPYLYGPLLSSINVLNIGDKDASSKPDEDVAYEEGGTEEGNKLREEQKIPSAGAKRMKYFLNEPHRKAFTFEKGRDYRCDFFNPYLDFNNLALKLPVITLPLMRFWDGQPLRYVLKHKTADGSMDKELMVVVFTLVPVEEAEKEAETGQKAGSSENSKPASDDQKAAPSENKGNHPSNYVDEGVD